MQIYVGANLFAHKRLIVRINSHLQTIVRLPWLGTRLEGWKPETEFAVTSTGFNGYHWGRRLVLSRSPEFQDTGNRLIVTTITFDTHKFIRILREAGFEEKQAEAVAEAFKEASVEAELATKRDIERLEAKLDARFEWIDGQLTLVQWMLALVVAAEVVPPPVTIFR